jgi:UDP-galactopyranose mutase
MKYLVVGAGFTGAVIAHELAQAGHQVRVIDRRNHVAGNAYDARNRVGIRVHHYGPHLFHTKNESVWHYLQRFAEWIPYRHRVVALWQGQYLTLPVNRHTAETVGRENVIDIFYRPYTRKMWGMELEELDPSIPARVRIRDDLNEYYFPDDLYQGLPRDGYTALIEEMLRLPGVGVDLECPYRPSMRDRYDHIFTAAPRDEWWGSCFGKLPWRSIRFTTNTVVSAARQPVATVNYTDDGPDTRTTEWIHLPEHGGEPGYTTLTTETPCDPGENNGECYYPIQDLAGKNRELFRRYASLVDSRVTFVGRCGNYAYIDMDQAVSHALSTVRRFLNNI